MRNLLYILLGFTLVLGACSPQRLASTQLLDYHNGRPVYFLTGYTDAGDTKSGASRPYVNHALAKSCPDGIDIKQLREQDMHNVCCKFLYWEAKVECR